MPQQTSQYPPAQVPKRTVSVQWKSVLAAFLAFIFGLCLTSCGSSDPKESQEYKNLSGKYSKTDEDLKDVKKELKDVKEELDQTKDDLKDAKKKADKWDKEQEDRQAAEEEEAADKTTREQEKEVQEQAHRQHQHTSREEAQRRAPVPTAPEPSAGLPIVHGGSFCSPAGATGQSERSGKTLTCRTARDGRLRWMK